MIDVALQVREQDVKQLEARLLSLGNKIARREYAVAVRIASNMIRKTAREHLEIHRRTGKLIKSLKVNVRRSGSGWIGQITNTRDTFYGMFLEFGTEKIDGTHWLEQAGRYNEQRVIPRMAQYLRERLRRLGA